MESEAKTYVAALKDQKLNKIHNLVLKLSCNFSFTLQVVLLLTPAEADTVLANDEMNLPG